MSSGPHTGGMKRKQKKERDFVLLLCSTAQLKFWNVRKMLLEKCGNPNRHNFLT